MFPFFLFMTEGPAESKELGKESHTNVTAGSNV